MELLPSATFRTGQSDVSTTTGAGRQQREGSYWFVVREAILDMCHCPVVSCNFCNMWAPRWSRTLKKGLIENIVKGQDPLKITRKVINLPSYSKQANHISPLPVEPVGNSSRISIGAARGEMHRCPVAGSSLLFFFFIVYKLTETSCLYHG